jgi:hypothetical protein
VAGTLAPVFPQIFDGSFRLAVLAGRKYTPAAMDTYNLLVFAKA